MNDPAIPLILSQSELSAGSDALLQAMLDATPDFMVVKDRELRYRAVNAAFLRFLGRSEEAVIGRSDFDLFPAAEAECYRADDRRVLASGELVVRDEYVSGERGGRWFEVTKGPLRRRDGMIDGVVVTVRDISERKRIEQALRTSEARYRGLFETLADGYALGAVVSDAEGRAVDLQLLEANPAFERLLGLRRELILGRRVSEVLPQIEGAWVETLGQVALGGEAVRFERYSPLFDRYFDVTAFCPERGLFAAVFRDITERRRAQEAVRAERERLLGLMDMLPVYLVLLTPDYQVTFANRFFRERFGDSGGKRCFEYLFGRSEPCEVCETFKPLASGRPLQWEWIGPDGRHYYVYDFPFTDTDGSPLIMETGLDITDLKQAETAVRQLNATLEQRVFERTAELAAANRELESFSYSISHDLRAPLRAINGFAEVLREDYGAQLDETGQGHLRRMREASMRMGRLIEGLLDLSRVVRRELASADLDLSALAREIAADLAAGEPQRAVLWEIEPGLRARADPVLMRSLLENLLGNAWKFTARRELAVIRLECCRREGRLLFCVRDNGVGFDMAHAHKLFQPFERLHSVDYEGTGIGLATVRRIVERHGGQVWAEGSPAQGTAIFFTLDAGLLRPPEPAPG